MLHIYNNTIDDDHTPSVCLCVKVSKTARPKLAAGRTGDARSRSPIIGCGDSEGFGNVMIWTWNDGCFFMLGMVISAW